MDADVSADTNAILFFSEKLQYCSMCNTAVLHILIAILQYVQYQTICKYVQYTAILDVLRAPGRTEVYPHLRGSE
jgi:Na+/H+ antiporter NhaA